MNVGFVIRPILGVGGRVGGAAKSEGAMAVPGGRTLDEVVSAALGIGDVESAVIFMARPGSSELELAAVAGIDGPALDGLVAAVRKPAHPIVRTLGDAEPTFDVTPMNPGGPRLRSHLPIRVGDATVGVLAVAHQSATDEGQRGELAELANDAASAI
jgi:hypothetical protein